MTAPSSVPVSAPATVAAEPVQADRIFGYYLYGRQFIPDVCGYTNVNLVTTKRVEASQEAAQLAAACRQQVIVGMAHWPSDWRALVQPYADAGVLHSVYVADEPMGQGMKYEELARRISEVHAAGWRAMFTEEGSHADKPHPPVDYYGFDCYYLEGASKPHSYCEDMIQRHPEINVYVGYAFYNAEHRKACGWGYEMPDQRAQFAMAQRHRLGVLWFTWIDFPQGGCQYAGVMNSPETQAVHRLLAIGG